MADDASWSERRRALRVPVHGVAVWRGESPVHGTIENLSRSGALVTLAAPPDASVHELELKLGNSSGHVTASTVRVERSPRRTRLALHFEHIDPRLRAAIETSTDHAVAAAARKPVLVIDGDVSRRAGLLAKLSHHGMLPLAANTPLDAVDLLTNAQLLVSVCLLAPSFGQSLTDLHQLVADSFPWVRATDISDDLEDTVERAERAWSGTDMARFARAIA
jgi:hypothetical protein